MPGMSVSCRREAAQYIANDVRRQRRRRISQFALSTTLMAAAFPLVASCVSDIAPITESYESPAAAALFGHFLKPSSRYQSNGENAEPPDTVAINLAPSEEFDYAEVERDLQGLNALEIFEDSSMFAASILSDDSLGVLGTVFDVRRVPTAAADSIMAEWYGGERATDEVSPLQGELYAVYYQWCRTWPCHGATWVEVRPTDDGYAAFQVLLWSIE